MLVYDIQNLTKQYPDRARPANENITLQIEQGEILGILGDNGAGKTTLVRQMVNLLRSSSGSVRLFGQLVGQDDLFVPAYVGYMPQESAALNHLTVSEALYFTAHLRGLSRAAARAERDRLLETWQLQARQRTVCARLSGGQRRLLRLAVAVAGSPQVLILDEPTNDLDPQRRRLVWNTLRTINEEYQTTIVFITHDAIEAEKAVKRVVIMRDGRVVANGRPRDLKKQIDQKLRLELFLPPGRTPDGLAGLEMQQRQPGHWFLLLDRTQVADTLDAIDFDLVDDFRLYSATLEDLYLYYANQ